MCAVYRANVVWYVRHNRYKCGYMYAYDRSCATNTVYNMYSKYMYMDISSSIHAVQYTHYDRNRVKRTSSAHVKCTCTMYMCIYIQHVHYMYNVRTNYYIVNVTLTARDNRSHSHAARIMYIHVHMYNLYPYI